MGKVREASVIGAVCLLLAVWGGKLIHESPGLSKLLGLHDITLAWAIILYGLVTFLHGQHDTRTISPCMFSIFGMGLTNAPPSQYGDSIIKNDVWAGDEIMMLGGGGVENGCIIAAQSRLSPNFRSEAYGFYGGALARLVSFRFSEKIREKLLDLTWWDMPLTWIRENDDFFLMDMRADEGRSLEPLAQLKERKLAAVTAPA